MTTIDFGHHIKELREARGLSLRQLAAATGLTHHRIFFIEKGDGDIKLSTMTALLNFFDEKLIIK